MNGMNTVVQSNSKIKLTYFVGCRADPGEARVEHTGKQWQILNELLLAVTSISQINEAC